MLCLLTFPAQYAIFGNILGHIIAIIAFYDTKLFHFATPFRLFILIIDQWVNAVKKNTALFLLLSLKVLGKIGLCVNHFWNVREINIMDKGIEPDMPVKGSGEECMDEVRKIIAGFEG